MWDKCMIVCVCKRRWQGHVYMGSVVYREFKAGALNDAPRVSSCTPVEQAPNGSNNIKGNIQNMRTPFRQFSCSNVKHTLHYLFYSLYSSGHQQVGHSMSNQKMVSTDPLRFF